MPLVDFDPDAVYCGNVSSCSIKMALSIAAAYGLIMKGGNLIGAYLITRANVMLGHGFSNWLKTKL